MMQYKIDFYKKHKRKWEYQNKTLEEEYMDYITKQNNTDEVIQANLQIDRENGFQDYIDRIQNHRDGSLERIAIKFREGQEKSVFRHEDEYEDVLKKKKEEAKPTQWGIN